MTDESYGTIWVCVCCFFTSVNGECCNSDEHGGDSNVPLSKIETPFMVVPGVECTEDHDSEDCDCDEASFSWSQCEGCGSWLGGNRYAMTLWRDSR